MKHYTSIIFCLFFYTVCNAQSANKTSINALYLELGKSGLIYNAFYDHKFQDKNLGIRFGIGSNFGKYLNAISTGGGGYYLMGHKKSFFEIGVDMNYLIIDEISHDQRGFEFVYPDYTIKTLYASINIGYRMYGKKNFFRIGVSPGLIKNDFIPGGYISYGVIF